MLVLDHSLEEVGQFGLFLFLVAEQVDGHYSAVDLAQSAEMQIKGILCQCLTSFEGHSCLQTVDSHLREKERNTTTLHPYLPLICK